MGPCHQGDDKWGSGLWEGLREATRALPSHNASGPDSVVLSPSVDIGSSSLLWGSLSLCPGRAAKVAGTLEVRGRARLCWDQPPQTLCGPAPWLDLESGAYLEELGKCGHGQESCKMKRTLCSRSVELPMPGSRHRPKKRQRLEGVKRPSTSVVQNPNFA